MPTPPLRIVTVIEFDEALAQAVAYSNVAFVGSIGGWILAPVHAPPSKIVALGMRAYGIAAVVPVR